MNNLKKKNLEGLSLFRMLRNYRYAIIYGSDTAYHSKTLVATKTKPKT